MLVLLVLLTAAPDVGAQVRKAEFEVHDRGQLWDTMKDDGTVGAPNPTNRFEYYPSMDWPGGPPELTSKDDQRSYNAAGGMWIGGRKAGGALFFTENGPFTYVDPGTFGPIDRVDNFVEAPGYDPAEAEQRITARWTTTEQVEVERTSRAWSFRPLGNFILVEYRITNRQAAPLTDVYVGFPYLLRPSYQDFVVHNGWGDDFNRTDDLVGYDAARALLYAWDDTPNFDFPTDVGNYWAQANELRTTGYAGVALLDAPAGTGGAPQPAHVLTAQLLNNEHRLSLANTSREALYALLSGADRSLQAGPDERITPFTLLACGPYTLAPGEAIRIVLAEAVNGLPIEEAVKGLEAQPRLRAGLDSLRATVDRARALFAAGYRTTAVPPPAPAVQLLALPATRSIALTWEPLDAAWTDPVTGQASFQEYRVYRSDRAYTGPYRRVGRIRPGNDNDRSRFFDTDIGRWKFIDTGVSLGARYFYAVTSVDAEGHESWLTNRNVDPLTVTSNPAENALNVKVFPNPFRLVSGFPTTGEENTIVWTNLPARATVRVYTASGELVKVIEHDDPASGQAVWQQLSDARQRTAPGVYFWTVESDVGVAKGTLLMIK